MRLSTIPLSAWIGILGIALALFCAVFAPFIAPHGESEIVGAIWQPMGGDYLLGTDNLGRDLFSRVCAGLANSLRIAVVSVGVAGVIGVLLGVFAGYFRGLLDRVVGVVTNVLFAFPSLLLALALAATLERSWVTVSLAIATVYMPIFARVARGPVLSLRSVAYVTASTAIGRSRLSTLFAHVVPNMRGILVVR